MENVPAQESQNTTKEQVFLSWSSPSRLFKRRNAEYFKTVGAIVFLLMVILVFASEYILAAAILSIVFLVYVLSTVPPENVDHRMTNHGIESAGHFYRWEEFLAFWFESQWGQGILILQPRIGSRVIVLVTESDKEKIKKIIEKYVPFREEPERTWVDNASRWISEKIPLEKPTS